MLFLLSTFACSSLDGPTDLNAEEQLLLDTVSAEEEGLAKGGFSEPDAEDRPPMFRECDPAGLFAEKKAEWDRDASGDLDEEEAERCEREREGPPTGEAAGRPEGGGPEDMRRHHMRILGLIYDTDRSGDLSDEELEVLFEDFELRCEALHDRVLEDFDADGDGELSDEEREAARDAIEAEREERLAEHEARKAEMEEKPEGLPPFLQDYDVDGDGELSDEELEDFRIDARERIRNGEPPIPMPE